MGWFHQFSMSKVIRIFVNFPSFLLKNINLGAHFLFLPILCSIKIEQLLFLKFLKIFAFFDSYFWPFNKSHEKTNAIFVISAVMASIWNVFIKFRWHDEKFTKADKWDYLQCPIIEKIKMFFVRHRGSFLKPWEMKLELAFSHSFLLSNIVFLLSSDQNT